jgi:hypothetical protein
VISSILERVWGGSIQLEMVEEYLVQVRKITDRFSSEVIEFPDEQEIARGSGVGTGDKTLKILRGKSNNWEKEGLVQFPTNWEWSVTGSPYFLPKDGAVVVQTNGDGNGHLQTLCMEKGLICMYPRGDREGAFIPDLKIGKEVRIVSNGIEARMYQVGDESPFAEQVDEWE